MKEFKNFKRLLYLFIGLTLVVSCSDDDDDAFVGEKHTYELNSVAVPSISGTATFIQNEDNSTTVELQLTGTPSGGMHPAHIHFNTAVEGGGVAVTLGTVSGDSGYSTITFSKLNDDTNVSFDDMIAYDGYINIHLSNDELSTIVAQGDIGQNELTGKSESYILSELAVAGISGTATFHERTNGEALAVLDIANTPENGVHPAHIHMGDISTPGGVLLTFNPVNGDTGMSKTNVSELNDESSFGYSDVLGVDGYINVHLSADALGTIVAQGNIGSN
mgnify:CR=1 FL=1|tara:strand:- start:51255 stop:52082 length:828 start_codon:yes stop_codon:yes gene_type:complete